MKAFNGYHEEPSVLEKSQDLYFGVVLAGFFLIVALVPILKGNGVRLWSICVSIGLVVASVSVPYMLTPFRKLWIKFGVLLHKFTQPLILGIVFYVGVAPVGAILRCLGKDPLLLKKNAGVASYWKMRDWQSVNSDMKNQF